MKVYARTIEDVLTSLGRRLLSPVEYTCEVFLMIYLSFRAVALDKAQSWRTIFSVVSAQIYFTGFQALPLISVLAIASGSIVILQTATSLSLLGGNAVVGEVLVAIVVRELAPLLTALIVISRSGTAVASEIGNMRVNREVEALVSMGIDPLSYVVFPRLLGGIVSVVCLAVYFVVVAILGGFLVNALLRDMQFSFFADNLARAFSSADVALFFLKNFFGGAIIFTIACFQGFRVSQGPHEVPQVTTKAVVDSVIYVVTFNMSLTVLYYLSRLSALGVSL